MMDKFEITSCKYLGIIYQDRWLYIIGKRLDYINFIRHIGASLAQPTLLYAPLKKYKRVSCARLHWSRVLIVLERQHYFRDLPQGRK